MPKTTIDYATLSEELENIMLRLQSDDVAVDEAISLYEQGLKLTKQLEDYLAKAQNTITKLQADNK